MAYGPSFKFTTRPGDNYSAINIDIISAGTAFRPCGIIWLEAKWSPDIAGISTSSGSKTTVNFVDTGISRKCSLVPEIETLFLSIYHT